jgi:hypothetical protein
MSKALIFLRKLITLAIIVLIFAGAEKYHVAFYISMPVLNLAFALIASRISGISPKELYNFQRNEKYFSKGGMRDLLRIPVMFFSFIHDFVVWEIWGLYQLFEMLVDTLSFFKDIVYWIFFGIIWFLKLLVPFWRITLNIAVFYLLKWPWWIFRYAYQNMKSVYNWNMLRIALPGSFLTLLLIQFFIFLDITYGISGLMYIGFILGLLPLSWTFGEIASVRGKKLMNVPFFEVKLNYRNGLESVRGILFFVTFFVVLLLAQAGLNLLGWIPGSGIIFLGIVLNINFLINIILLFLVVLIVFGTIILPSYRLYNEFSETSLRNLKSLIAYISKRFLQYIAGLVPSSVFAFLSVVPIIVVVILSVMLTLSLKDNILDIKISKLKKDRLNAKEQIDDFRISQKIQELTYYKQFPTFNEQRQTFLMQEMKHRQLLVGEIENEKKYQAKLSLDLVKSQENLKSQINKWSDLIQEESRKNVINQTKIEEVQLKLAHAKTELGKKEQVTAREIKMSKIKVEFLQRKNNQIPIVFYLSGLFAVIFLTLIFNFYIAYLGNFFYTTFIYRNDGTIAEWRNLIRAEQETDARQPLLSTTLNLILLLLAVLSFFIYRGNPGLF